MAKRTLEELLKAFGDIVGDNTDDAVLALMEDITDSMTSNDADEIARLNAALEEANRRFEENDQMHRRKYRDRFMGIIPEDEKKKEDRETVETKTEKEIKKSGEDVTFEDVFTEEKKDKEDKN